MSEEERQKEEKEYPPGFIPKDEWVAMGNSEEDWRNPEEFERRGEEILPIVKADRDRLKEEISQLRDDVTQFMKSQEELTARKEKEAYNRAKSEYEAKVAQIKEMKREAVRIGDEEAYEKAEKQEERLEPPKAPEVEKGDSSKDFDQWKKENPWWEKNPKLTRYARAASVDIQQKTGLPDGKALYDAVAADVKENFPEEFENQKRNEPSPVNEGAPSRGKRKKTERDLPKEAKDAINRFMKMNPKLNRDRLVEGYINQYFPE